MRTRLVEFALRFPAAILAATLAVAALALERLYDRERGMFDLPVDASLSSLLPVAGDALETYTRTAERFGSDDVLLVAWFDEDLFSPAHRHRPLPQPRPGHGDAPGRCHRTTVRRTDGKPEPLLVPFIYCGRAY